MSRLADPTICPDCRGSLDPDATCTQCGLRIRGPLAGQLWAVMVTADGLVERLRLAPESAPGTGAVTGGPTPVVPGPAAALPRHPGTATPAAPRPRRLPSASVPVVLLSLGALCLLVAAVVFVAVTWSLLGLTGRTLVLLAVTAAFAAVATVLTRKGLRGAAETFWLVVAGMLTVDLLGAQSAGLLGLDALSWRGTSALVGVPLLALGVAAGAWARSQPVGRLLGAEAVAVLGALLVCASNAWFAENPELGTTIAVPLLGGGCALLRRRVPVAAYGLGGVGAVTWFVLLGEGWARVLESATLAGWWSQGRGWPLLAAFVLAAVAAQLVRPDQLRSVVAGLALVPLVLLGNGPETGAPATQQLLLVCATLAVLGALTALAGEVWARGAAVLTGLGIAGLGVWLAAVPFDVVAELDPDGVAATDVLLPTQGGHPAWWTFPVAATALVLAAYCLVRRLPARHATTASRVVATLTPVTLALGLLALVLELAPPLWAGVLAGALATAAGAGAAWWSRDRLVAAVAGSTATAYLAALTLYAAAAAHLLSALAATAIALVAALGGAVRERERAALAPAVLGAVSALLGGWALVSWGLEAGLEPSTRALLLAVYAAAVGLLAAPATRQPSTRVALEASAAVLAVLALAASGDERTAAMVLTVVGTGLCAITVSTRDRLHLGWAGAAVLGIATVLRVDAAVRAPELYTLPAALLLVAAGAWRLYRDPTTTSVAALGSGLTLALLPSLLLALDEPVSVRGVLVGAASVLTLAAGLRLRLAAPFVLGALATGVLAIRHLEPVAEAVPRWVSLGGVGVVLLLVGVTWEARRRDLDTAQRYLAALR